MAEDAPERYRFGPFVLNVSEQTLCAHGRSLALRPTTFRTLVFFVRRHGHLVEKQELLKAIWPDTFVDEGSLTHHISMIRKALARESEEEFIETVPTRGYRFVAEVIGEADGGGEKSDAGTAGPWGEANRTASQSVNLQPSPTVGAHQAVQEFRDRHNDPESAFAAPLQPVARRRLSGVSLFLAVAATIVLLVGVGWRSAEPRGPSTSLRTLAVLPFQTDGIGPAQQHLGVALADVLISRFSRLPGVAVRPITGVLKFSGNDRDALAVGRILRVDFVLDGRIQPAGDSLRATVHVIDVRAGTTPWSKTLDAASGEVLHLENDLAEQVAHAVLKQLTEKDRALLAWRGTSDPIAHDLYLRARARQQGLGVTDRHEALALLEQAVAHDPDYALAYAGLADAYAGLAWLSETPEREALARARAAAYKALAIDRDLQAAYTSLAFIDCADNDWAGADEAFRRALALNGNDPNVHYRYAANLLLPMGRFAEATNELSRALALDPSSLPTMYYQGSVLFYSRRYAEAEAQFKKTLQIDPDFGPAHLGLSYVYTAVGRYAEARDELRLVNSHSTSAFVLAISGHLAGRAGRRSEALAAISELRAMTSERGASPLGIGNVYAGLGDADRAVDLFSEAFHERAPQIVWLRVDPLLDSIRSHPRFQKLIAEIDRTLPAGVAAPAPNPVVGARTAARDPSQTVPSSDRH